MSLSNQIIESCSSRIKMALDIRGMKQYELCEKTKIPKSAISQYISGSFKPSQERTFLIAQALSVDPAWLMGFDVPMESKKSSPDELQLTEGETALIQLFRKIPQDKQRIVIEMIRAALSAEG